MLSTAHIAIEFHGEYVPISPLAVHNCGIGENQLQELSADDDVLVLFYAPDEKFRFAREYRWTSLHSLDLTTTQQ